MKTFICVKRAAILLDAIIGISADNKGNVYIARDTTAPQLVEPYDEDELRQYIRNGELDACNIGCGDAAFELPADGTPAILVRSLAPADHQKFSVPVAYENQHADLERQLRRSRGSVCLFLHFRLF